MGAGALTFIGRPLAFKISSHVPRLFPRFILAAAYVALVIYGSLFPMHGWQEANFDFSRLLSEPWPQDIPRADLLTNVLVYIPVGLLIAWVLRLRLTLFTAFVLASAAGILLSLGLELIQLALPNRVSSSLDLLANGSGSVMGAALGILHAGVPIAAPLFALRRHWFQTGPLIDVGLVAVFLWTLSQLSPFVPSIDIANLRAGLSPLWQTLNHPERFQPYQAASYAFYVAGLGFFVARLLRPERAFYLPFFTFIGMVLLFKVPVVGRQLSLEALAGMGTAMVLVALFKHGPKVTMFAAMVAIVAGFITASLWAEQGAWSQIFQPFNWVPFSAQMTNIIGLPDILADLWPFLALAVLSNLGTQGYARVVVFMVGGAALFSLALALEFQQQTIAGRSPDITDALLALIGWMLPWLWRPEPPGSRVARAQAHGDEDGTLSSKTMRRSARR